MIDFRDHEEYLRHRSRKMRRTVEEKIKGYITNVVVWISLAFAAVAVVHSAEQSRNYMTQAQDERSH